MPTLDIRGIPVAFPFTPYASQLVYMEKVILALETKQNALLESPTGTGKTLCLLCATLAWRIHRLKQLKAASKRTKVQYESIDGGGADDDDDKALRDKLPKIIYASRTHSQLKQVVKELKQTPYKPKVAILGSREHLCVHPEISSMRGTQQNHTCRQAVRAHKYDPFSAIHSSRDVFEYGRCTYKTGYDRQAKTKSAALPILDIEELVTTMKDREVPQAAADIVFMPYNYLVEPFVRNSLGVTLENAVLIFDEAHNESVATDAASYSLSSLDVQGCIKEVEECHNLIVSGRIQPGEDTYLNSQPGAFIFEFFNQFNITFDTAPMVVTITEQVIEAMSDYAQSNPRNSKLDQLLTFLRTIYRDKENHQATTVKELGISFPIQLENAHVIDASQVWVGVVGVGVTGKKLNASYESRNSPDYAAELGNTLVNITRLVPNGLLVFFPSYSILDQCTAQWQQVPRGSASGAVPIWERLAVLKTIFIEPKNRVEFTTVVQEYHNTIETNPSGAIFFAVCRGKVSEGIDFSNENGRAVVITGLPFPPTKDPKIMLKKAFLDNQVVAPNEMVGAIRIS
ncbi:hypothetical protein DYB32_010166, partial [Aphanomyces invadans]